MKSKAVTLLLPIAALALAPPPRSAVAAGRPADHVFVIMLDGARPDALRRADTPVLRRLADAGALYTQARTQYPSQTRVSFVTLPTGAYPEHHGIVGGGQFKDSEWRTVETGDADPVAAQALVAVPTMFEDATAAGLSSLYAAMKGYELVAARGATWTINGNQTLDPTAYKARYQPEVSGSADLAAGYKLVVSRQLLDQVLALFRERRPNLVVLNLGSADYTAHTWGPDSPRYLAALAYLDGLVGELVTAVGGMGLRDRTAFIVSADHGFSSANPKRVVLPAEDGGGHRFPSLAERGIEHFATGTGGSSLGLWVRDKARVAEAAALLRAEPWAEAVYCEDPAARCDRSLRELRAFFPGRSPDLMVDLDDDFSLTFGDPGEHGSLRENDMRIPLILSGAGVADGGLFGKAALVDVAPTALRLLGVTPRLLKTDGRVLEEALIR